MLIYATISSGANISGDVDLRKYRLHTIFCPVVDSGDLALRANHDQTSAGFRRMLDVRGQNGSGDLRYPIAAGSNAIPWTPLLETPSWLRLETIQGGANSFQTDNRTFALSVLPR